MTCMYPPPHMTVETCDMLIRVAGRAKLSSGWQRRDKTRALNNGLKAFEFLKEVHITLLVTTNLYFALLIALLITSPE